MSKRKSIFSHNDQRALKISTVDYRTPTPFRYNPVILPKKIIILENICWFFAKFLSLSDLKTLWMVSRDIFKTLTRQSPPTKPSVYSGGPLYSRMMTFAAFPDTFSLNIRVVILKPHNSTQNENGINFCDFQFVGNLISVMKISMWEGDEPIVVPPNVNFLKIALGVLCTLSPIVLPEALARIRLIHNTRPTGTCFHSNRLGPCDKPFVTFQADNVIALEIKPANISLLTSADSTVPHLDMKYLIAPPSIEFLKLNTVFTIQNLPTSLRDLHVQKVDCIVELPPNLRGFFVENFAEIRCRLPDSIDSAAFDLEAWNRLPNLPKSLSRIQIFVSVRSVQIDVEKQQHTAKFGKEFCVMEKLIEYVGPDAPYILRFVPQTIRIMRILQMYGDEWYRLNLPQLKRLTTFEFTNYPVPGAVSSFVSDGRLDVRLLPASLERLVLDGKLLIDPDYDLTHLPRLKELRVGLYAPKTVPRVSASVFRIIITMSKRANKDLYVDYSLFTGLITNSPSSAYFDILLYQRHNNLRRKPENIHVNRASVIFYKGK